VALHVGAILAVLAMRAPRSDAQPPGPPPPPLKLPGTVVTVSGSRVRPSSVAAAPRTGRPALAPPQQLQRAERALPNFENDPDPLLQSELDGVLGPPGAGVNAAEPCVEGCADAGGGGSGPAAGAGDGSIDRVRIGGEIRPPTKLRHVDPRYPELARAVRVQGLVQLDAVIDPTGRVVQLEVVSGHPLLVPAALAAVREWVYEPTLLNGVPVSCQMTVTLRFVLPAGGRD
jgi:protein TonB